MNRLTPDLERLIVWARQAPELRPKGPPAGFAVRVTRRWYAPSPINLIGIWQEAIWGSAWAAAAVIVLGLALLGAQRIKTNSSYDVSPAFQLVSTELVP